MASVSQTAKKEPMFELWMLAHFSLGADQITFFPVIVVRYVTDVTGNRGVE